LPKYVGTIANTSLFAMDRSIRKAQSDKAGLTHAKYFGQLDQITRSFCRRHVNKIHTWQYWESESNDTGPNPVSIYCGGYNCRHSLIPYDPAWDGKQEESQDYKQQKQKEGTRFNATSKAAAARQYTERFGAPAKYNLPIELANEYNKAAEEFYELFPSLKGIEIKASKARGYLGMMNNQIISDQGNYYLNQNISYSNLGGRNDEHILSRITNEFKQQVKTRFNFDNTNPKQTVYHELAHAIDYQLTVKSISGNKNAFNSREDVEALKSRRADDNLYSAMLINSILEDMLGEDYNEEQASELTEYLGRYAHTNNREMFAQAIAEGILNKDQNVFSKRILDKAIEDYEND